MTATRDRIAHAAREILRTEGTRAVSMRRVATCVGITPMAIYRHYPNREALLNRVAEDVFTDLAAGWAGVPPVDDLGARMRAMLDGHIDFALQEPRLYDFVFLQRRAAARSFPADFRAGKSPSLSPVADAIAHGMSIGQLRDDDAWELALLFAALLHGLVALYHGGRIDMTDAQFRDLCHRLAGRILDGLTT